MNTVERLEVLAYVDETDIGRVIVGQDSVFTVDTFPDVEFIAEVTAIQPRAELQGSVVNYLVRLEFERSNDYTLRPEMTAHVRIVVDDYALEARTNLLYVAIEEFRLSG